MKEYRVRYELQTAYSKEIHAVICGFGGLKYYISGIKTCKYRLVGVDKRYRDKNEHVDANERWKVVKEWQ